MISARKDEPEIFGQWIEIDGFKRKLSFIASFLAPALGEADECPVGGFIRGAHEVALVYEGLQ